jgi:hypothetical protein
LQLRGSGWRAEIADSQAQKRVSREEVWAMKVAQGDLERRCKIGVSERVRCNDGRFRAAGIVRRAFLKESSGASSSAATSSADPA